MKNRYKILIGTLVIFGFEFYSLSWFDEVEWESFWGLWGLLFTLLLFASIFGLFGTSYSGSSIVGGSVKGSPVGNVHITDDMIKPPKKKKNTSGLFKNINAVYAILIFLNLLGYLLTKST